MTFGQANPTRASSETDGHSGRLANDGNATTFWQADASDTNAWLRVDMERIVTINKTKLTFPTPGNWRYKIEISDDGDNGWKLLADQMQTSDASKERTDMAQNTVLRGRFLRVTIVGTPANQSAVLSELEVTGTLNTQ